MKPRALKKRATEDGVDEEKIDEADDADDVKACLVSLIMEKAGFSDLKVAPVSAHYGTAAKQTSDTSIFATKHIVLSYQWDVSTPPTSFAHLCHTL